MTRKDMLRLKSLAKDIFIQLPAGATLLEDRQPMDHGDRIAYAYFCAAHSLGIVPSAVETGYTVPDSDPEAEDFDWVSDKKDPWR